MDKSKEPEGQWVGTEKKRYSFVLKYLNGNSTRRGYHVHSFEDRNKSRFLCFDNRDDECLRYIEFINGKWEINTDSLQDNLIQEFGLRNENNKFILDTNDDKIEVIVKFLKNIIPNRDR
jgi:hypothetical protein